MPVNFHFVPPVGDISGEAALSQIERAFNELGGEIDTISDQADNTVGIAQNAKSIANAALQVAQNAESIANTALTTAQGAETTVNTALTTAQGAETTANTALTTTQRAETTANTALATAQGAETTANTALTAASNAEVNSSSANVTSQTALELSTMALGVFTLDTTAIDANSLIEKTKLYLINNGIKNFPVGAPLFVESRNNSTGTALTQDVWSGLTDKADEIYRRVATLTPQLFDGETKFTFAFEEEEKPIIVTVLNGTLSGSGAIEKYTEGTIIGFELTLENAAQPLTEININDEPFIFISSEGDLEICTFFVPTPAASMSIAGVQIDGNNLVITLSINWQLIDSEPVKMFGVWTKLGGSAGGESIPGAVQAFSGTFGGPDNKHPINPKTSAPDLSFAICDGSTYTAPDGRIVTTPNLMSKFILGAGMANPQDSTGGSWHTNSAGAHTHTITVANTAITVAQMAYHTHGVREYAGTSGGKTGISGSYVTESGSATAYAGSNYGHNHSASADSQGAHVHQNVPPYYALTYIMQL